MPKAVLIVSVLLRTYKCLQSQALGWNFIHFMRAYSGPPGYIG
jgi:hypothetical protein